MVQSNSVPDINGEAFKLARQSRSLSQKDLAYNLCLSVKHIDELENNKSEVFFSISHRYQVAQKVAEYLNLSRNEAFFELSGHIETTVDPIQQATLQEVHCPSAELKDKNLIHHSESQQEASHAELPLTKQNLAIKTKQTKNYIGLVSMAVVVVILVINSGLLSFSVMGVTKPSINEKPVLVAIAVEEVEVREAAKKTNVEISTACEMSGLDPYAYKNPTPSKPANYLYVVSKYKSRFCVLDAKNISTDLELEVGQARSIYGSPPFVFISKNLENFDIFYEGNKVFGIPQNLTAIKLMPN
jgi:transcriptional regulator with XRE-family HTH domain